MICRCQLYRKPSLDDRCRKRCRSSAGTLLEGCRQFFILPEPHQLPVPSYQEWPSKSHTSSLLFPNKFVSVPISKLILNASGSFHRTVFDRARSRSNLCWSPVWGRRNSKASPQKANVWRRTLISHALLQMSGTLTSEGAGLRLESCFFIGVMGPHASWD